MPLTAFDRHVARRFSGGPTPDLLTQVEKAGGGRAWFDAQLSPTKILDPLGTEIDSWFPSLKYSPLQIFERQQAGVQGIWDVMPDLSRWTVARRVHSTRQVQEVMVDFWSNLLNVSLGDDPAAFYRVDYDQTIRRLALSSFEQILAATIVHPAMGLYLDNAVSTKDAPNENLGRELLELHTVGVDAGYTEQDVKQSSRLLTGYRVDVWAPSFRSFYDPSVHYTGPIKVMGFSHTNSNPDGRAAVNAYLSYLARHPATAQRLAHRLCVRFVSDSPSPTLVSAVATAYRKNGTRIVPTLKALVGHSEFAAASGKKIRTPIEDYVATVRALQIRLQRPVSGESFANAMYGQYREHGNAPYEWPAPNGYPELGAAWTSTGRVLNSVDLHDILATGWWPSEEATYRAYREWLPPLPATLDTIINHIGNQLFGQAAPAATRQGVASLLGLDLTRSLTGAELVDRQLIQILATLLNAPTHAYR